MSSYWVLKSMLSRHSECIVEISVTFPSYYRTTPMPFFKSGSFFMIISDHGLKKISFYNLSFKVD